jgi:hypothetical protein
MDEFSDSEIHMGDIVRIWNPTASEMGLWKVWGFKRNLLPPQAECVKMDEFGGTINSSLVTVATVPISWLRLVEKKA